jgi:hypothetical protein
MSIAVFLENACPGYAAQFGAAFAEFGFGNTSSLSGGALADDGIRAAFTEQLDAAGATVVHHFYINRALRALVDAAGCGSKPQQSAASPTGLDEGALSDATDDYGEEDGDGGEVATGGGGSGPSLRLQEAAELEENPMGGGISQKKFFPATIDGQVSLNKGTTSVLMPLASTTDPGSISSLQAECETRAKRGAGRRRGKKKGRQRLAVEELERTGGYAAKHAHFLGNLTGAMYQASFYVPGGGEYVLYQDDEVTLTYQDDEVTLTLARRIIDWAEHLDQERLEVGTLMPWEMEVFSAGPPKLGLKLASGGGAPDWDDDGEWVDSFDATCTT